MMAKITLITLRKLFQKLLIMTLLWLLFTAVSMQFYLNIMPWPLWVSCYQWITKFQDTKLM